MSNAFLSLVAVARRHGVETTLEHLVREFGSEDPSPELLFKATRSLPVEAALLDTNWDELVGLTGVFPFMALKPDGGVLIVAGIKQANVAAGTPNRVAVLEPPDSALREYAQAEFEERYSGRIILIKKKRVEEGKREDFGMRWFIPEILKQKVVFRDIAVATFMLGIVGLGTPIFTQQVIDKVMVHHNMSTLVVLTIGVLVLIFFESVFTYIRTYLLNAATRKIDLRLSRETFNHLVSLPLQYFECRSAGIIVRQLQQVSTIRNFLTGSIFFTALEAVMFIIFLPILMMYSISLTLVVLAISLLMAGLTYILIDPYRKRLEKVATVESVRQGMLVETVHGVRTVKALAIESNSRKLWEQRTANTMDLLFDVMTISNVAGAIIGFLQKFMTIAIMVVGSFLVIEQEISLGVLIGFNMLAGRVTGPIAMLVGLIHEYQQVKVSANMLADIMNSEMEPKTNSGLRPQFQGKIDFEAVTFRYPGSTVKALDSLSFGIEPGEIIGVVGKSGSGKSTLAKVLQALYLPQEGVIRLDGIDIREFETAHLRRQVGVVLQDSFLFRGTVRENISAARPSSSLDEVIAAAQAAGAAEFIEKLPQSYDTLIEENATNLSGGQRQRLAIARALVGRPRILIFDEATSALDPDSETVVMQSLSTIAKGRTVVMISHRLSTLVSSTRIAFMEQGKLLHIAPHKELLEICEPYKKLWLQQNGHLLS